MKTFVPFAILIAALIGAPAYAADPVNRLEQPDLNDRTIRELEAEFAPKPVRALEIKTGLLAGVLDDSEAVDSFVFHMQELVDFGNDLVLRCRTGYRISASDSLYMKDDGVMLSRNKERFSFGVLNRYHSTGPAIRWTW